MTLLNNRRMLAKHLEVSLVEARIGLGVLVSV